MFNEDEFEEILKIIHNPKLTTLEKVQKINCISENIQVKQEREVV